MEVLPGALNEEVSLTITDGRSDFLLSTDQNEAFAVFATDHGPDGIAF